MHVLCHNRIQALYSESDVMHRVVSINVSIFQCTIHVFCRITSGRVLDGELLYTKILKVNLFAFAYRLFHEDFSSINSNANKLTSRIFVDISMYSGSPTHNICSYVCILKLLSVTLCTICLPVFAWKCNCLH